MMKYNTNKLTILTTCYSKEQIAKVSFMKHKTVSIDEVMKSEIPMKDKIFAVGVLLDKTLTPQSVCEDFKIRVFKTDLPRVLMVCFHHWPEKTLAFISNY